MTHHHRQLITLIPKASPLSPLRLSRQSQQPQNILRPFTSGRLSTFSAHLSRTRSFSTSPITTTSHQQPRPERPQSRMLTRADLSIADSTPDQETLVQETSQLVENGGRWRLCREGRGIERGFKFKTFKTTWVRVVHLSLSFSLSLSHFFFLFFFF